MKFEVTVDGDFSYRPFVCDVHDEECAAKEYVDRRFSDLDYPSEVDVFVRDLDGTVTEWVVESEAVPIFRATRKVRTVKS